MPGSMVDEKFFLQKRSSLLESLSEGVVLGWCNLFHTLTHLDYWRVQVKVGKQIFHPLWG